MKKIVRNIVLTAAMILFAVIVFVSWKKITPENYRDLNKNGKMDVYEIQNNLWKPVSGMC